MAANIRSSVGLAVALMLVCGGESHAQALKEEARLLDKPEGTAKGPAISGGTAAKVLERQGFWLRVEAKGQTGWIRASALTFSSSPGGPAAIDTGRLGKGNIVATSAARGLSSKDLLEGRPRPEEVAKLSGFAPPEQDLKVFAATGGLVSPQGAIALKAPERSAAHKTGSSTAAGGASPAGPPDKKAKDDW